MSPLRIDRIDWNEVWNSELAEVSGRHDTRERWDLYAPIFNNWKDYDDFSSQILPHLDISPADSVLDIGCGTGSLTLPVAKKASRVTALDLSPEMLKLLQQNANSSGIRNLSLICRSWESVTPGVDILEHDVVIASRSLGMENIGSEILKMVQVARKRVYLVWRAGKRSFDAALHEAIGREYREYPGYDVLYTILYSLGFFPVLRVFHTRSRLAYPDLPDAEDHWRWKLGPFSREEEAGVAEFLRLHLKKTSSGRWESRDLTSYWALIELKKD